MGVLQRTRETNMSMDRITQAKEMVRRYGFWIGVRAARNRGVPFEEAYYAVFGRTPRV